MVSKIMFITIVAACLWASGESITSVFDPITRQITRLENEEPDGCNVTGTFCSSCKTVSECINLGNGDYLLLEDIITCDTGTCSNATGACTTSPNPSCDATMKDFSLTCHQVGLFPHPFNTTKYFICQTDLTAKLLTCPVGYAYDVYSSLCRVKLPENTFGDLLIQPCKMGGDRGAIPNHPSMYYVCLKKSSTDTVFSPDLFMCGSSQFYNNATKLCQDRSGPLSNGKCATKVMFYDSAACGTYTECVNGSLPIKRTCSAGWYFDERKAACTAYSCLNVKY